MSGPAVRVALLHDDRDGRQAIVNMCTADLTIALLVLRQSVTMPQIRSARADVLLIDSRLSNALEICNNLGRSKTAVIFVDVPRDGAFASDALQAGARGLVFEDEPVVDVLRAIHLAHVGAVWAPRETVLAALRASTQKERSRREEATRTILARLSPRELEVMRHAAAGLGNKELAEKLSISRSTVKAHLTHIYQKLGVHGRVELAAAYYTLVPSTDYRRLLRSLPSAYIERHRPVGLRRRS